LQKRQNMAQLPKQVGRPRRRWLVVVKWLAITALAGLAIATATVATIFWMYGRDPSLPTVDKLRALLDHPKQITKVLDKNDREIGELGAERRTFVPFDKIPTVVVDAFVAAEDNNFWTHGGVDYMGMARAVVDNLRAGHAKEGASTITQQVVKNFLLTSERTFKRKIQEVILARRLEHALSKQDIMTLYLNQIDFGRRTFGVQEAARLYFGKDIGQVSVGEAAVLAALPKEPERLYKDLHGGAHPERAKARQVYVLEQMVKIGKLAAGEAQKFIDAPIQIYKPEREEGSTAPEWVDLAKAELERVRGKDFVADAGGRVRTTLDPGLQDMARAALQSGLRAYDKRHKIARVLRTVGADKLESEIAKLARKLPKGGPQPKELYDAVVTGVFDDDKKCGKCLNVDLGHWPAQLSLVDEDARYNPPGDDGKIKTPSERFKTGDVVEVMLPFAEPEKTADEEDDEDVKVAKGKPGARGSGSAISSTDEPTSKPDPVRAVVFPPGPEGAVVVIDVPTRKVRALVGGYTSRAAGFDRATMAKRQPGSAFKPIVYAAAFEQAVTRKCHANDPSEKQTCATASSIVNDAPERYESWVPRNFESGEFLGPVRLRTALAKSLNTVSAHLVLDMGPEAVVDVAHRMGITSQLAAERSIALGSSEVTPLELVNAYVTLAAGGIYAPPRVLDAIDGTPVPADEQKPALAPEVAYVLVNMMEAVTTEGTAAEVGDKLKVPIAGKTGTSNEARNTWFIGMTPDIAIGVWVGYDDNRQQPGEQGARVAAPIFIDVAKQLQLPGKQFVRPPKVVDALVDKATGLLAPEGAPKDTTLTEVFVDGTQPVDVAPKPGEVTEGTSVTGEYGN
jgi:penicillin-binding protein 1A